MNEYLSRFGISHLAYLLCVSILDDACPVSFVGGDSGLTS